MFDVCFSCIVSWYLSMLMLHMELLWCKSNFRLDLTNKVLSYRITLLAQRLSQFICFLSVIILLSNKWNHSVQLPIILRSNADIRWLGVCKIYSKMCQRSVPMEEEVCPLCNKTLIQTFHIQHLCRVWLSKCSLFPLQSFPKVPAMHKYFSRKPICISWF